MLRTTISKLRQVCALTFVPRLFRGDLRCTADRFEKLSVCVQRRVDKSTSSSDKEEDEYIRCQRIIDRAFSPNPPFEEPVRGSTPKENVVHMVTPKVPLTQEEQCEKCKRIINEIFGEEAFVEKSRERDDRIDVPLTELQATTAKEHVETLAQKVEHIDETPLVEAPVRRKVPGFNIQPKVLGNKRRRRIVDRVPVLNFASNKSFSGRRKGTRKDANFDELAKRCLNSPSSNIDERLLKEMEQLGVPPTSRRSSRRTAHDAGIVQPEIMKRPRRPVTKPEVDYFAKKATEYERLNSSLPPPFELIPIKSTAANLESIVQNDNELLIVERIPPYHLKDQILADLLALPDNECADSSILREREDMTFEAGPPQHLLGQITATVMSDESTVIADKHKEVHHLDTRQKRDSTEQDKYEYPREKLASTHLLSEIVNPKEISPYSASARELKEIQMLRNILRTRIEYLTQEKIKIPHTNLVDKAESREAAAEVDRVLMKELSESEVDDTLQQLGVENVKLERIKPRLKEDLNIIPREEPSIVIRDFTEQQPLENTSIFKSYSEKRGMITPHQFFEELSIISRETEIDVIFDDIKERDVNKLKPESIVNTSNSPHSQSPGQFIEHVGIVSKDSSTTEKGEPTITDKVNANKSLIDSYDGGRRSTERTDYKNLYSIENTAIEAHNNRLLKEHFYLSTTESGPLNDNESEEPVLSTETSRLPLSEDDLQTQQFLNFRLLTDRDAILGTNRVSEASPFEYTVPSQTESVNPTQDEKEPKTVTRETLLNPLLDKGTVGHVDTQNLNPNMFPGPESGQIPSNMGTIEMPKEHIPEKKPMPLSEMLRRVRERNRIEFCKQFEVRMAGPEVEPLVGECGKKQPPCPPPAPTCPPPPPKPCPPTKPPCPNPCKPKCPPTCPPSPCEPKPKCPPVKKSPCEKFKSTKCTRVRIQDVLSLLLYLGPQFDIPQKKMLPFLACVMKNLGKTDQLTPDLRVKTTFFNFKDFAFVTVGDFDSAFAGKDLAKTYDPWTPIPSWPVPVKERERKLVCPKDGCKTPPPKLNAPCRELNPCLNLPKKHFSIIDFLNAIQREEKSEVLCDITEL